jgi:RNA polymerase sigma factor (sigma-70 family)
MERLPDDFYRAVTARIVWIAEKIGVPKDQCADVAQEAMLSALEHNKESPGTYTLVQLRSWFALVGCHRAVDARRKLVQNCFQSLDDLPAEPMDAKAERGEEGAAWIECVQTLLERLRRENSKDCRLVYERYLEERKIGELAEERGWTAHKVSVRIHRAMQKMRSWASESSSRCEEVD